jgi:subtilisin family serine protease
LTLAALVILFLLPASTVSGSIHLAANPKSDDRVSSWVWRATSDGGQTDFLVVLAEQADVSPARTLASKQARGRFVRDILWETAERSQAPLRAWLDARGIRYRSYYIVNLIHVQGGDRALVEALASRPDVDRIEANPAVRVSLPPPATTIEPALANTVEPNISHVGAPGVWALGYTGQAIVVGGQDTGYDWDHPALKLQYLGWNGSSADHDYHWHDAIHAGGGTCGADSLEPCDDYGHGTHTMGTVLGDDGAGWQIGMAPGARWIGCRNMSVGVGTPATYLECFEFFLAPYPVNGTPAQGNSDLAPDVTNNSWSCPPSEGCSWGTLQAAVEAQRAAGILTVASAGNSGSACSTVNAPPAIYDATYTVGATYLDDTLVGFSSRGPVTVDGSGRMKPDLTAPGSNIVSSTRGGGYGSMSGTSMAAPHVAGAIALLWSAAPDLVADLDLTEAYLNQHAQHIASSQCSSSGVPNNLFGWGRLDVLAAVQAALQSPMGYLAGQVQTEEGTGLTGATITASTEGKTNWTTTTGTGGQYSLTLPANNYNVWAETTGYEPSATAEVQVTAQATATLNFTLTAICQVAVPALIDFAPDPPLVGQVVSFTAAVKSGQPPITYTWDFGDNASLALGNPITHTFPATRTQAYTVTLTVDNACQDPASLRRRVTVFRPEDLGFLAGTVQDDQHAPLADMPIDIAGAGGDTWFASSGPGGEYRIGLPTDIYTVSVTAAGFEPYLLSGVGITAGLTTTLDIVLSPEPPCESPVAGQILFCPVWPLSGEVVIFTGTLTAGELPVTWNWDLGDGSAIRPGNPVMHIFSAVTSQVYTVTLTVDNRCQQPATMQQTVGVRPRVLWLPLVLRS